MGINSIANYGDIFQRVKEIPFPEVQKAFHGAEPRRSKIPCPFHDDKSPSFHLYPNGYKCYGCGESGDSVAFVSKLLGIRPLEAAKAIAEPFGIPVHSGPLTRKDRLKLARARAERLRQRKVEEGFRLWIKNATIILRTVTEAARLLLEK